jgi:23S rRNA U2552 (ribose-2'-O)-methylase RlmE/FtsJ
MGILDGDNLANTVDMDSFLGDLATIKKYSDALDEAKRIIAEEILEPVEPEVIPGDITGTGEVGDDDFDQFVEDLLAGNVPAPGDANFAAYDANGDGKINIGDLQAIFNLSMGLNPDGSDPDAAGVRARAYGIFDAGNMAVEATKLSNGNTMLAVKLSSTTDYLAFQMDVVMGDGMSVVSENANLQLLRSNDLSNIHRIVGYGLLENNGTMLTLEVAGEGNVQFTNIVLATEKAEAVKFNLGGNTTGISTIAVEKNDGNFIYDLSGKLMNGIKKGINIIRGKNGETKKVVK